MKEMSMKEKVLEILSTSSGPLTAGHMHHYMERPLRLKEVKRALNELETEGLVHSEFLKHNAHVPYWFMGKAKE